MMKSSKSKHEKNGRTNNNSNGNGNNSRCVCDQLKIGFISSFEVLFFVGKPKHKSRLTRESINNPKQHTNKQTRLGNGKGNEKWKKNIVK